VAAVWRARGRRLRLVSDLLPMVAHRGWARSGPKRACAGHGFGARWRCEELRLRRAASARQPWWSAGMEGLLPRAHARLTWTWSVVAGATLLRR
jgi:hypothetical protein